VYIQHSARVSSDGKALALLRKQRPGFCHAEADHGANEVYKDMFQQKIDADKLEADFRKA